MSHSSLPSDYLVLYVCTWCGLEHYLPLGSFPGDKEYCEYCERCFKPLVIATAIANNNILSRKKKERK
jgi:hypothetical protein